MAPFDPNSLAAILGMAGKAGGNPMGMAAPLGMQPMINTSAAPGFVGINGEGLTGKELPGLEGLGNIPGHNTMMAAAQAGDGAGLGLGQGGGAGAGPMAAILGMEALKALSSPPPQPQMPGMSTGAAPRGQQVNVSKQSERLPVNGRKAGMNYGGQ